MGIPSIDLGFGIFLSWVRGGYSLHGFRGEGGVPFIDKDGGVFHFKG